MPEHEKHIPEVSEHDTQVALGEPPRNIAKTSAIAVLFGLLVSSVLILVTPDKQKMLSALMAVRWPVMLVALGSLLIALFSDAARLWWLCRGLGANLPLSRVFQAIMAANAVSLVTPFVSGGAPCIVWVLQQSGVNMSGASAAVVAGGVVSQSTLVTLSVAIPLLSGIAHATDPFARLLWTATLAVVPLYLSGVALVLFGSLRIDYLEALINTWDVRLGAVTRGKKFAAKLQQVLRATASGLHGYRSSFQVLAMERPSVLVRAFACSLLYFMALFTVGWLTLVALGVNTNYLRAVAAQVLILLAASATPTPGGSGATEFGAYSLFTLLVPQETVAVFIVIWRILTYWLLLFTGLIALALAIRRSAESIAARRRAGA